MDKAKLKKIASELKKASAMHKSQAARIDRLLKSVTPKKKRKEKMPARRKRKSSTKKKGSTKDACYYKVKRSYKVFPSAYASGAIAKCRKRKARGKK